MKAQPLLALADCGQSLWLDYIRRDLMQSGRLRDLIHHDGLRGITSNPTIFDEAIAQSDLYDGQIASLALKSRHVREIYDAITIQDVQAAADEFRPVYDGTGGADGYVSLEANPHLARNTSGTVQEVRRLWAALDRPNVFVKVPATTEGIPAIQQLICQGINVNVTLLFGLVRYRQVAEAYLAGLEDRAARNLDVNVASVASFFVSRIDTNVDKKLEKFAGRCGEHPALAGELYGQVAIAQAKIAYQMYQEIFGSRRFWNLEKKGARAQRLLWASTSTKNPEFSDVKYVEALIGENTVNTVPMHTLEAYRDHGSPGCNSILCGVDHAAWVLEALPLLGICMDDITRELEEEGADKFSASYDSLFRTIEQSARRKVSPAA